MTTSLAVKLALLTALFISICNNSDVINLASAFRPAPFTNPSLVAVSRSRRRLLHCNKIPDSMGELRTEEGASVEGAGDEEDDGVVAFWEEEDYNNDEGNDDVVLFRSSDRPDDEPKSLPADDLPWKNSPRWKNLHPKVRLRIIEEGQRRAIANKKKRESKLSKKRRMMMYAKKAQIKKKKASRVKRDIPFSERTPLSDLSPGMVVDGKVISLTTFGAYIDVGTECDGLLHVSQISDDEFVESVKDVLEPGDEVTVRINRVSPELRKLHLTMLPEQPEPDEDDETDVERIKLEEIDVDDELWGEIKRVTAYGAYVELGAEVNGFLHFMDHPDFGLVEGALPSTYMKVGQRVRVWAAEVDMDRRRIKLTANRPQTLPQIRREVML